VTKLLLREAAKSSAATIALAALTIGLLLGWPDALAVLLGGAIASLNFLGLVYLVGEMLNLRASGKRKGRLFLILLAKLALGGLVLWAALVRFNIAGIGVVVGIGAAILGFVAGVTKGSQSKAAEDEMKKEEERLEREDHS
jgi:hypothetical protein